LLTKSISLKSHISDKAFFQKTHAFSWEERYIMVSNEEGTEARQRFREAGNDEQACGNGSKTEG
jgi:hypothetical protein